jgi:hypothetical protein
MWLEFVLLRKLFGNFGVTEKVVEASSHFGVGGWQLNCYTILQCIFNKFPLIAGAIQFE